MCRLFGNACVVMHVCVFSLCVVCCVRVYVVDCVFGSLVNCYVELYDAVLLWVCVLCL